MKQVLFILLTLLAIASCKKEAVLLEGCPKVVATQLEPSVAGYTLSDSMQLVLRAKGYDNYQALFNICTPWGAEDILILETNSSKTRALIILRNEQLVEFTDKGNIRTIVTTLNNDYVVVNIDLEAAKKPCNQTTTTFAACMKCSFSHITNDLVGTLAFGLQPYVVTAAMAIHCS